MWKKCGHNHQTMETFLNPAKGLLSYHKLCLTGSVSAWPLIIASNKGYLSVMVLHKYNYFLFILQPSVFHLCYLHHPSYPSPPHHALCEHLHCF